MSESKKYLSPKESGEFILSHAKHVKVNEDGIGKCASEIISRLKAGDISLDALYKKTDLHPQLADEKAVDWVFFLSTLNFSFWTEEGCPKYEVTYKGKTFSGYLSLCAAVNRALDAGVPLTQPNFYGQISENDLGKLLVGDGGIQCPLLSERVRCLHEVSKVLEDKFSGSFVPCLESCNYSAQKLLNIILDNFDCYHDISEIQGQRVAILKRAQILVSDLWALFEGKGLGRFDDIESLSMFADYRVPQSLQYFKIFEYSPELVDAINEGLLPNGSLFEVEIRGCSIAAVERIVKSVKEKLAEDDLDFPFVNAASIDYFLWGFRREKAEEMEKFPYHKTRSIYY